MMKMKHNTIFIHFIDIINIFYRFVRFVWRRFFNDKLPATAASLTFTTLLALVPLMTVGFALLRAFPAFENLGDQISAFVFTHFVPAAGEIVQGYLNDFTKQAAKLTTIGSAVLLITALLTMATIEHALNDIWNVQAKRRGVSAFMLYWAVITMAPVLIGVSLMLSSYLISLPFVSETAETLGLRSKLLASSPFILECAAFTLLYVAVPNTRVRLLHSFMGGVLAVVLFEFGKWGFALYVTSFPTYQLLYGALATIPIFLLWVYVSWLIILLGAQVVYALSYDFREQRAHTRAKFVLAYFWLGHLWQAQCRGEGLSFSQLLQCSATDSRADCGDVLLQLMQAKLIQQLANDKYALVCDLNHLTVNDLYHRLPWQLPDFDQFSDERSLWAERLKQCLAPVETAMNNALAKPLSQCYFDETAKGSKG